MIQLRTVLIINTFVSSDLCLLFGREHKNVQRSRDWSGEHPSHHTPWRTASGTSRRRTGRDMRGGWSRLSRGNQKCGGCRMEVELMSEEVNSMILGYYKSMISCWMSHFALHITYHHHRHYQTPKKHQLFLGSRNSHTISSGWGIYDRLNWILTECVNDLGVIPQYLGYWGTEDIIGQLTISHILKIIGLSS